MCNITALPIAVIVNTTGTKINYNYGVGIQVNCFAYTQFQVPRDSARPKALRMDAFRWDANDLTRLLKGNFCDLWNQHITPNMNQDGKVDMDAVFRSATKDKGELT